MTLSGKFSKQYFLILGGDVRNEKWTNEFWHLSKVVEGPKNMIGTKKNIIARIYILPRDRAQNAGFRQYEPCHQTGPKMLDFAIYGPYPVAGCKP